VLYYVLIYLHSQQLSASIVKINRYSKNTLTLRQRDTYPASYQTKTESGARYALS